MNLNWVDHIILAIIVLCVIVGLWRGFVREIIALLLWALAFCVAIFLSPWLADTVLASVNDPHVRIAFAFVILVALILVVSFLLKAIMGDPLASSSGINWVNRFLGACLGFFRALVIISILLLAGVAFGFNNSNPSWQASTLAPYFSDLTEWVNSIYDARIKDAATAAAVNNQGAASN